MGKASANELAAALGRIASGVFILTARHGTQETGMLASWVQQCSFDPPLVTMAIKRDRHLNDWLEADTPFILNILDDTQTDMIAHFGRGFSPDEPAFDGLLVERHEEIVVLKEALGFLLCRVRERHTTGDHNLYVSEVVHGRMLAEGQPMVHIRKNGLHY